MERNHLQPNNTYNASFAPNFWPNMGQQQGAQPEGRPVPPLGNVLDLPHNPSARNLQAYNFIRPIEEAMGHLTPDNWNLPEYQPIQPGEPYMEKLKPEDQAEHSKTVDVFLKHAQEYEELGRLQHAEEAYKEALKYTDNAEHYKLYAACLQKASAALKDATKANVYREKAARAFYYLGDLYQKQTAWKEAQAAYKVSCELVLYEAPLQALVDVARHLEQVTELAAALEKLADFYAEKGAIALAIDKLNEAFEFGKVARVLEKLEALYSGEGNQSKLHEIAIQRFELQISQDPKNIGLYRDYAWFLKDIGKRNEARAVKKRIDELLQQKLVKQKAKIGGLKAQVATLEKQVLSLDFSSQTDIQDADLIALLKKNPYIKFLNLEGCKNITDAGLAPLKGLKQLTSLNLQSCVQLTDEGLQHLAGLTQLTELYLRHCKKLTDVGLEHLAGLTQLTVLALSACQLTDAGLRHLAGLPWLTELYLGYCNKLTDACLQHLAGLTRLTKLGLGYCDQLTDAGLQHLASFNQLTLLGLMGCTQLTDACLEHLSGLTWLTTLYVNGCTKITNNAKEQLKRKIPGLKIEE